MIDHVVFGRGVTFYALRDPRDNRVRWVGQTTNEKGRLAAHMNPNLADTSARAQWIRSLRADGLRPVMERLERCSLVPPGNPGERERHWMSVMLAAGEPLLNITLPGHKRSEESKQKQRASRLATSAARRASIEAVEPALADTLPPGAA